MGIELKKINGTASYSIYALEGDPTNLEYTDFVVWLNDHCLGDYTLDRYHLFIGYKSEVLLTLKWI